VYGRRRCGKSTLLQQVISDGDVYHQADQKEARLQLADVTRDADRAVPRFSSAAYADWDAVLTALDDRLRQPVTLCLDEFPYLVQQSPELPSVLQRYLDRRSGARQLNLVLCGSSQRMMHGLVLDRTAPLYGRALEILKIGPLPAGWIREALALRGERAVEAYAVWGGVPRYWELAAEFGGLNEAVRELVLHRNGVLHDEPLGLLRDEMRSAVQPYSLLSVIGQGCHRLSEIAGRLGKPATSLTRPLSLLVDLDYVRRDTPFGEPEKSTRRALYKIADPFLAFHFRFVQPNRSALQGGALSAVAARVEPQLAGCVSMVWEELARASVPHCGLGGFDWGPARRWWGTGSDGRAAEIDVVAESVDGRAVLVGEAKWSLDDSPIDAASERLAAVAKHLPWARGKTVVPAVWARREPATTRQRGVPVLTPDEVLDWLV
jgi:hypothetical protein